MEMDNKLETTELGILVSSIHWKFSIAAGVW